MKYGELVQFDPIEDVVQLREADDRREAERLVRTYVISDGMAEKLASGLIPHLKLNTTLDKKGLLIVGNYGTGKSHLMSVISAVAEHTDLASEIRNSAIQEAAESIAGQFIVIRTEIGAVRQSLRDIVCGELQRNLEGLGVSYTFPPDDQIANHKDAFIEMMQAFGEKYPDKGLLLVVDELLDYLRSRQDADLVLDLNFMREIGESCRLSRFRFIAGVQEALFDNPRFEYVAESMQRVQKRFESVRIYGEDVAYVVSERLLVKTPDQEAKIRAHLERFTPLYGDMNERLDEYVALFPVHPRYLETFERLYMVEKREVLKTISHDVKRLIELEVPADRPGILSFDRYWDTLSEDMAIRTNQDIRVVLEKGHILQNILERSFEKKQYLDAAVRIIHALAVHRLTTGDVSSPIGLKPENLRDDLCLYLDLPEPDSEFLLTTIETVLHEISKTVSGQFISHNAENDMYYLDVRKDIDYDAKIEERAATLDKWKLDHYYFDALARVMKTPETTYVSGYKIWQHEVIWADRKAGRPGYLFFGAPNERSTAQPPRDFYIYFIQPFDKPDYDDERRPDEVFLKLLKWDDEFHMALKRYAGAREMASSASATNRGIYEKKAGEHLAVMVQWMRDNMMTAYRVTYGGVEKNLLEWAKEGAVPTSGDVRATINGIAAYCLAPHFEDLAPDYPRFSQTIRGGDRDDAVKDALTYLRGGLKTQRGVAVLDALGLLEGEQVNPENSEYAEHIVALLRGKAFGQVLNRSEIIVAEHGIEYERRFRLEPEYVGVLLAALVYHGDAVVAYPGAKVTAANLEEMTKRSGQDLTGFRHVELPKDPPIEVLAELFKVLGLMPGLVKNTATHHEAVKQLQGRLHSLIPEVVEAQQRLDGSLLLWERDLYDEQTKEQMKRYLDNLKVFLESLQRFNTEGRLKNYSGTKTDVRGHAKELALMKEIDDLARFCSDLAPLTVYLSQAEIVLPDGNVCREALSESKRSIFMQLESREKITRAFQNDLKRELENQKKCYIDEYFRLHRQARLGHEGDERKKKLKADPRLIALRALSNIEIMPKRSLTEFDAALLKLQPCFTLTEKDLKKSPVCPHCSFRPADDEGISSPDAMLDHLEDLLDAHYESWTSMLVDNLDDPTVQATLELLKPKDRALVMEVREHRKLPEKISADLVRALTEALSSLVKVTIRVDELRQALMMGGSACSVEEIEARFGNYVSGLVSDKDERKVRLVVE
ncbi:MAG: ATP-binding protein [Methanomicrobiales archaeon]|nr:ATP-binding protein [Methanomicrobiales archaeon]